MIRKAAEWYAGLSASMMWIVGLTAAALLTSSFVSLAEDVLLQEEVVGVDRAIIGTVYDLRSSLLTGFFRFITYMGGIEAMLAFLIVAVLLSGRHRLLPMAFGAALALAVIITQALKIIFGRLRPDQALQLVVESGFSFPSGHTFVATVMYGLGGYMLWRTAHRRWARLCAVLGALTMIVLVACSRVYLGVHYPSDVLASFLLGTALLCLLVTAIEVNQRYRIRPGLLLDNGVRRPLLLAFAAAAVSALALSLY